jgi:molecular chaperone HtpG
VLKPADKPMNIQKFQVDLESIITLLSRNLYSSPKVYIRELLQNAVDAIAARNNKETAHDGLIRIHINTTNGYTLTIEDNGIGLSEQEVGDLLSTVGASTKRDDSRGYLGQFGIGLLSCFMVSSEIVVITKTIHGGAPVEWKGNSDGTFSTRLLDTDCSTGTHVFLRPKPGMEKFLSPDTVRELVIHYGDLLPYPILFTVNNTGPEQLNSSNSPIDTLLKRDQADETSLLAYGESIFQEKFLAAIPLRTSQNKTYGVAYVLKSTPSLTDKHKNRVYLKRMLLSDENTDILPAWSFFVRAIINTRELKPTASREALYQDDNLEKVSKQLGRCIRNYLARLHQENPSLLDDIISTHRLAMKMLAKDDKELYKIIIHYLKFNTSLGQLTIRDYLKHSKTLNTVFDADEFDKMKNIARSQQIHLINTQYDFDEAILSKLNDIYPQLERRSFSFQDLLDQLDMPDKRALTDTAILIKTASSALDTFRCSPIIRLFEPESIPVLHYADDLRHLEEYANRMEKDLPPLWGSLIESLPTFNGSIILCFNYRNPLIRHLATLPDSPLLRHFIQILFVQSLLLGNRQLNDKEIGLLTNGLDALLQYFQSKE